MKQKKKTNKLNKIKRTPLIFQKKKTLIKSYKRMMHSHFSSTVLRLVYMCFGIEQHQHQRLEFSVCAKSAATGTEK